MNELTLVSYKMWGRVLSRRWKTEIGKRQLMSKAFYLPCPKATQYPPTNCWLDYHLNGNDVCSITLETKKMTCTFNHFIL